MKNTIHNEHTGKVIDTMIRMTKVLSRYSKSITDFINLDLAEKSELSGRQIERMRKYEGYPEDKSAIKLINGVELLSFIDPTDYLRRTLINDKMIALFLKYQPRLKLCMLLPDPHQMQWIYYNRLQNSLSLINLCKIIVKSK